MRTADDFDDEDDANREDKPKDPLRQEIDAALERGEAIDFGRLAASYPCREATLDRLRRALNLLDEGRLPPGSVSARRLPRGTRLGEFVIEEELASGGTSVVYRARQPSVGRLVALKVIPVEDLGGRTRDRFRQECAMLARFDHPGVVKILTSGETPDHCYYAMPLIPGMTLREAIADGIAPASPSVRAQFVPRIVQIGIDLAEGLSALHATRLVHRDVKPSNVILKRRTTDDNSPLAGDPILVDFGLVKPIAAARGTRSLAGVATEKYAPQEQLDGEEIDARADVFSLGVTLHDLLSGRTAEDRKRAASGLEPLREVPPNLAAVITKAIDPKAENRYADAGAFKACLEAVQAESPMFLLRSQQAGIRLQRRLLRHARLVVGTLSLLAFATWSIVEWRRATAVEAAAAGDDLLAVQEAGDDLGWLSTRWLDRSARTLVERLRRDTAERDAVEALRRDAVGVAIEVQASVLRSDGYRGDVLARDFLRHVRVGSTPEASSFFMRLGLERQAESEADQANAAEFAILARELLATASPRSQQHALVALSGVGSLADVALCLTVAGSHPTVSELRRLGIVAAERIVRRCQRCGTLTLETIERVEEFLAGSGVTVGRIEDDSPVGYPLIAAGHALTRATLLARRARGEPSSLRVIEDLDPNDLSRAERCNLIIEQLAAIRDPRAREVLSSGTYRGVSIPLIDREVALSCGLIDDINVEQAARRRLDIEADRHVSDLFSDWVDEGRELTHGRYPAAEPDEESRMRWPLPPATWVELAEPQQRFAGGAAVGRWSFYTPTVEVAGAATGARCVEADRRRDEDERLYLRLYHPGRSVVELDLIVPDAGSESELLIRIEAEVALRSYAPYCGVAHLEGVLDDTVILDRRRYDSNRKANPWEFQLPTSALTPGEHRLSIHLDPSSTTTVRLYFVALIDRP